MTRVPTSPRVSFGRRLRRIARPPGKHSPSSSTVSATAALLCSYKPGILKRLDRRELFGAEMREGP